jgi:Fe-S-cluster containining protein
VSEDYDCEACGACCVSNWDTEAYVYVDEKDIKRLRLAYSDRTVKKLIACENDIYERGLATKENKQGHITCVALNGSVGSQCSCRIYDARPRACREFKPGSMVCKAAREEASIPSPAAAEQT